MTLQIALADYLRTVASDKDEVQPWTSWCREHQTELLTTLTRPQFLRLKHSPETEIPGLVEALEVDVSAADLRRPLALQKYFRAWRPHPGDLPSDEHYDRGEWAKGDDALIAAAQQLWDRVRNSNATDIDAYNEFADLLQSALVATAVARCNIAAGLLFAVASRDEVISLINHEIQEARAILEMIGGYHPEMEVYPGRYPEIAEPESLPGAVDELASPSCAATIAAITWLHATSREFCDAAAHIGTLLRDAAPNSASQPRLALVRTKLEDCA